MPVGPALPSAVTQWRNRLASRWKRPPPAPEDGRLFAQDQEAGLARAAAELGWLLERAYALPSALKLVGDRHALTARQRLAVQRAACTPAQAEGRAARRLAAGSEDGGSWWTGSTC